MSSFTEFHRRKCKKIQCQFCFLWSYWRNKIHVMKNNYIFLHVHTDYLSFRPQRACDCKTTGSHLNRAWKKTEFCLALSIFQILLVLGKSWFVLLINIVGRWFNYLNVQKENLIILSLMTWQHFSGAVLSNKSHVRLKLKNHTAVTYYNFPPVSAVKTCGSLKLFWRRRWRRFLNN